MNTNLNKWTTPQLHDFTVLAMVTSQRKTNKVILLENVLVMYFTLNW